MPKHCLPLTSSASTQSSSSGSTSLYMCIWRRAGLWRQAAPPTDPGLGDPAGPQSQLEARGGRHQVERCDPRSGQEIRVQSRRRVQVEGARVIPTPLMAPRANAHAERWIGSWRRECLDWTLLLNERHLEAILPEYCPHYNGERPIGAATCARQPRAVIRSLRSVGESSGALASDGYSTSTAACS